MKKGLKKRQKRQRKNCFQVESEIAGAPNWRRVPGFPIYATGGYNDNIIIITMIIICVKGGYDPKQRCQPFDIYIFL